jgi:hypothetical protein
MRYPGKAASTTDTFVLLKEVDNSSYKIKKNK